MLRCLNNKQNLRVLHLSIRCKSTAVDQHLQELEANQNFQSHVLDRMNIPFARSKIGQFFQQMPKLGNQFTEDVTLQTYLRRLLPEKVYTDVSADLTKWGNRVATDVNELGDECDKILPYLRHYDAWGNRIDEIVTCPAWKQMKSISAEEGLISIAYERNYAQYSRLYQIAKLYLYSPSAGLYSCPVAMTDGAARSLEMLNDPTLNDSALRHLTSRDPTQFWTSGQWMTERKGGSDVANGTQTLAVPQADGSYSLHGYKWFTSATDADMALTLAREVDSDGQTVEGTRGLSMFFLKTRDSDGRLNNIEVQRLKEKLGTRQVPTAELLLDGTQAYRISPPGRGVAHISTMLTLTRIHNSLSAAGGMRRITNLARDYAVKRQCFGKYISDHSLHVQTLANMEVEARVALLFTLEIARVLGLQECHMSTDHQDMVFRLLTPLIKLYTAKQAVSVASEGLESFGGAGYMEDTGLPRHLRDAQVLPIWEGTTNILSLDVLRAIAMTTGACLQAYRDDIHQRAAPIRDHPELAGCAERVINAASGLVTFSVEKQDIMQTAARQYAYSLARTYMGMLVLEHANHGDASPQDIMVAKRWFQQDLTPVLTHFNEGNFHKSISQLEYDLVYDGYVPTGDSAA